MTGKMNILDPTGHTALEWKVEDKATHSDAQVKFDQLLGVGWAAVVSTPGLPAEKLTRFDPRVEEMTLIPPLAAG